MYVIHLYSAVYSYSDCQSMGSGEVRFINGCHGIA